MHEATIARGTSENDASGVIDRTQFRLIIFSEKFNFRYGADIDQLLPLPQVLKVFVKKFPEYRTRKRRPTVHIYMEQVHPCNTIDFVVTKFEFPLTGLIVICIYREISYKR